MPCHAPAEWLRGPGGYPYMLADSTRLNDEAVAYAAGSPCACRIACHAHANGSAGKDFNFTIAARHPCVRTRGPHGIPLRLRASGPCGIRAATTSGRRAHPCRTAPCGGIPPARPARLPASAFVNDEARRIRRHVSRDVCGVRLRRTWSRCAGYARKRAAPAKSRCAFSF